MILCSDLPISLSIIAASFTWKTLPFSASSPWDPSHPPQPWFSCLFFSLFLQPPCFPTVHCDHLPSFPSLDCQLPEGRVFSAVSQGGCSYGFVEEWVDEDAQAHIYDKFDQNVNPFRTLDHLRLRLSFTTSFKYFDLISILPCSIPLSAGTSEKQTIPLPWFVV